MCSQAWSPFPYIHRFFWSFLCQQPWRFYSIKVYFFLSWHEQQNCSNSVQAVQGTLDCEVRLKGELVVFSDLFDFAFSLTEELRRLRSGTKVPLYLYTDCKSLFDVVLRVSRTSERCSMLDISAARKIFKKDDLSNMALIRYVDSITDSFTKCQSQATLQGAICVD